jgi:hypothetical protein
VDQTHRFLEKRSDSTPSGVLVPYDHASRGSLGDHSILFGGDFALDIANTTSPAHYFARSRQGRLPHQTKEINFEFDGGEGFIRGERAGEDDCFWLLGCI